MVRYQNTLACYPNLRSDLGTLQWLISTTCTYLGDGTGKWPSMICQSSISICTFGFNLPNYKAVLRVDTATRLVRPSKPCMYLGALTSLWNVSMTFMSITSRCRLGLDGYRWTFHQQHELFIRQSSWMTSGYSSLVASMEWSETTCIGRASKCPTMEPKFQCNPPIIIQCSSLMENLSSLSTTKTYISRWGNLIWIKLILLIKMEILILELS